MLTLPRFLFSQPSEFSSRPVSLCNPLHIADVDHYIISEGYNLIIKLYSK